MPITACLTFIYLFIKSLKLSLIKSLALHHQPIISIKKIKIKTSLYYCYNYWIINKMLGNYNNCHIIGFWLITCNSWQQPVTTVYTSYSSHLLLIRHVFLNKDMFIVCTCSHPLYALPINVTFKHTTWRAVVVHVLQFGGLENVLMPPPSLITQPI